MATEGDVRRIANALPGTEEGRPQLGFGIKATSGRGKGKVKGYAWSWKERVDPKKARVENRGVLAVRVRDEEEKQILLSGDPDVFFTEPHYNGFPAVLIRLKAIKVPALRKLLTDAHALMSAGGSTKKRPSTKPTRRPI